MRTVTLLMAPKKPTYNLRVMEDDGVRNHLGEWGTQGAHRRLSAVVGEGKTLRIGLFDNDRLSAVTSISVTEGRVLYNGKRVLPIVGATWEGLFQEVRIVPSLFAKKEK
jgi:hypothetical protein